MIKEFGLVRKDLIEIGGQAYEMDYRLFERKLLELDELDRNIRERYYGDTFVYRIPRCLKRE